MAKRADATETTPDPETPAVGKGRPTPTRAEREAQNRRPLVATTKEARQAARADLRARQDRARAGMAAGEERYLPPKDKGPQRRFARDWVDAGWHLGEFLMPMMILVIIATFAQNPAIQFYSFIVLWGFILLTVVNMIVLGQRVKRKVARRFGADRVEKGLPLYAALRSAQMRFMRLPKPQVKRGEYPALDPRP